MFIPRIGQEVIVEFLEGDPDRPIITGRVYHGTNKPPVSFHFQFKTRLGALPQSVLLHGKAGQQRIVLN